MNAPAAQHLPVAGQAYGGGIFSHVYLHGAERRALILAPKVDGEFHDALWHREYTMVAGALSFVDGLANTRAMAEAGSEIAEKVLALRIGSKDDWCIPALDQLEPCYRLFKPNKEKNYCWARSGINLSALPPAWPYTPDFPQQTEIEIFRTGGSEAFEERAYWTSTQDAANADCAWLQGFDGGFQDFFSKDYRCLVRAVRSEPI